MSVSKHWEKVGITVADDNSLPPGQRTQKCVKRLIAAVRAAEGEFNDELRDANERCRIAQDRVIECQARIRELENQLLRYKLDEKLEEIEKLTQADRQRLLEVA